MHVTSSVHLLQYYWYHKSHITVQQSILEIQYSSLTCSAYLWFRLIYQSETSYEFPNIAKKRLKFIVYVMNYNSQDNMCTHVSQICTFYDTKKYSE